MTQTLHHMYYPNGTRYLTEIRSNSIRVNAEFYVDGGFTLNAKVYCTMYYSRSGDLARISYYSKYVNACDISWSHTGNVNQIIYLNLPVWKVVWNSTTGLLAAVFRISQSDIYWHPNGRVNSFTYIPHGTALYSRTVPIYVEWESTGQVSCFKIPGLQVIFGYSRYGTTCKITHLT